MRIIIYGNGRIARTIYQFVRPYLDVICFTAPSSLISEKIIFDLPVVPFETIEKTFPTHQYDMLVAVGYANMNELRRNICTSARVKGYRLASFVHPSVVIHKDITLGDHNIILDHVSIHPGAKLGDNNFIWSNVVISHGCRVDNDCWIASGATIGGGTTVKSGCFFGINSSIGHNLVVDERNFIGAGATVTRSTEPDSAFVTANASKLRLNSRMLLKFSEGL